MLQDRKSGFCIAKGLLSNSKCNNERQNTTSSKPWHHLPYTQLDVEVLYVGVGNRVIFLTILLCSSKDLCLIVEHLFLKYVIHSIHSCNIVEAHGEDSVCVLRLNFLNVIN